MEKQEVSSKKKLKDEKLRALQLSAADTIIRNATESGMKLKSAYGEDKIELEFTQSSGKKITIYARYEDFATGGNRIVSLVGRLDGNNR